MVVFYNMSEDEVKNYLNFHLSIEISQSSLSLLLLDKSNQKPVAIEHFSLVKNAIESSLKKSEIISKTTPNSVSCSAINSVFTLVPNPLFEDSNKQQYLSFSSEFKSDFDVLADKHLKHEVTTCFGIESIIKQAILSLFPLAQFKHNSSILCDSISDGFHINFANEEEFEVAVISDKKLLFYNHYLAENKDEVMYYISLIADKLSIEIQKTILKISGSVEKNGKLISFFNQFIPEENLTFNEIEPSQLNAIDTHRYFTLHKQFQCVS